MLKFLEKLFGNKHQKDIGAILPIIEEINEEFSKLSSLSDDQLRGKTQEFKSLIAERVAGFRSQIDELNARLRTEELNHEERLSVYDQIHKLEEDEHTEIEVVLDEILPEAFAVVKEACRRLVGTEYDVVGQKMVWDMVPYDVQLIGGVVLHQGKIAEMATGEGKTLVAVCPVYLNALAGRGVHLVTVNDYLARRDSQWMGLLYNYMGLTVGCIQSSLPPHERHAEYMCDITYGTNNEFGFDYLRDNMVNSEEELSQRDHWYAIVDEVDSVLVDEARTPLIISGPVAQSDQKYEQFNPVVRKLVEQQRNLVASFTARGEELLKSSKKEDRTEAGIALLRAYRGFPKNKRLLKLLQVPENMKLMRDTELEYLRDQGAKMSELDAELYYAVDEKLHQLDVTEKGRDFLSSFARDKDFFLIPDIATEMSALEGNTSISEEERQLQKDNLLRIYSERSDHIHTVTQLLRAYTLYENEVEYMVQDGKVKIIDEFTGRMLEGRRYSDGLHQAIEAKEGVRVEKDTQTFATITLQNYFRLFRKLAGMTGTAETESAEFLEIYNLDVVIIPTNRSIQRKDLDDVIYRTKREKYNAVVEEIQREIEKGRAVLVGTTSVDVSELLSKMLKRANVRHNVLNAKHHQREAEIVQIAGQKATVTIATNMAGRGTDIKLSPEVRESGGLCIIGTERHESRRIDRQLRGRAGRQGDPGSSRFFLSLEDDLMRLFGGERIAAIMQRLKVPEGEPIEHSMVTKSVERAQKKVEENNFGIRKRLLEYDNVMNQQRTVIYDRRRHALRGERLKGEIFEYVEEMAGEWYDAFHPEANAEAVLEELRTKMLCDTEKLTPETFKEMSKDEFLDLIDEVAHEFYERKEESLGHEFMGQLERAAVLQTIDEKWREHLRSMDELKEGIHLRAYGQKDPLLEYKSEAFKIFQELIHEVNIAAVEFAFKYYPRVEPRAMAAQMSPPPQTAPPPQAPRQQQAPAPQQRPAAPRQAGTTSVAAMPMMGFTTSTVSSMAAALTKSMEDDERRREAARARAQQSADEDTSSDDASQA